MSTSHNGRNFILGGADYYQRFPERRYDWDAVDYSPGGAVGMFGTNEKGAREFAAKYPGTVLERYDWETGKREVMRKETGLPTAEAHDDGA